MAAPSRVDRVDDVNILFDDNFRVQFKRYKKRKPPPDLSEVINFSESENCEVSQFHPQITHRTCVENTCERLGLKAVDRWKCFTLQSAPGFLCIKDPFQSGYQRYWIKRCLQDYPNKPNVCNLDGHQDSRGDLLWDDRTAKLSLRKGESINCPMDQLRWVTLGYHYDWTAKAYHEHHHSVFPQDLADLSAFIASVVGYPGFMPQAGIVNYYHFDSALGGHTDHSEFDLTAPIISYSFGQSGIFLLGGKTKETSPLAMYLYSGDVIVMGGQSRLAYHAVPKILVPNGSKRLPVCLDRVDMSHLDRNGRDLHNQEKREGCKLASEAVSPSKSCDVDQKPISKNSDGSGITAIRNGDNMLTRTLSVDKLWNEPKSECKSDTQIPPNSVNAARQLLERTSRDEFSECSAKNKNHAESSECKYFRELANIDLAVMMESTLSLQDNHEWNPFAEFMSNTRVNISVRQVTGPGCEFPADTEVTHCEPHSGTSPSCSDESGTKRKAQELDQG